MIDTKKNPPNAIARLTRGSLPSLLTLILACVSIEASAQVSGTYAVSIGESTRLLEAELMNIRNELSNEQLNAIREEESCKNPSARLHDRNRPALMLRNTSNEANEIGMFTIDLTELGFGFGDGDLTGDGFNGSLVLPSNRSDAGVSISASYGLIAGLMDQTTLEVQFSGLAAGMAAIFRIDLDPVPFTDSLYPDYRTIILGADAGNGSTAPAMISATFGANGLEATTPSMPFDPGIEGILASGSLVAYHAQEESRMFGQTGSTEIIPEPSAAALLLAGTAGLMGMGLRRRNR